MKEVPIVLLVFDVETDGLLEELTTVHCLCVIDLVTGTEYEYGPEDIPKGLELLEAHPLVGHNIKEFDIPAIQKVYPDFQPGLVQMDTLLASRVIWPDLLHLDLDLRKSRTPDFPGRLLGSHSLEAWGYRMGCHKDTKPADWSTWTPEMQQYCMQDVRVNAEFYKKILSKGFPESVLKREHQFLDLIYKQQCHGFHFKERNAEVLLARLKASQERLAAKLQEMFPPVEEEEIFVPKVNNKARGYVKGVPFTKVKTVYFNPNSEPQIAERLSAKFGWKPKTYTKAGSVKLGEDILMALPWAEAKVISKYQMLTKRISMIEGPGGWLPHTVAGRIHGRVITNGTPTARCRHFKPNIAQVTGAHKAFGPPMRHLFGFEPGETEWVMVGFDASALEMRCLAHYLQPYDGGRLIAIISTGQDMHQANVEAANALLPDLMGRYSPKAMRELVKKLFYALIYGASDRKLAQIAHLPARDGKVIRAALEAGIPGLKRLTDTLKAVYRTRGHLVGLDGRRVPVPSVHALLNYLLQSAGAIVMKTALVYWARMLDRQGYPWTNVYNPETWALMASIHDEGQAKVRVGMEDTIGKTAVLALEAAGKRLNMRCPMTGEYAVGQTWRDTH